MSENKKAVPGRDGKRATTASTLNIAQNNITMFHLKCQQPFSNLQCFFNFANSISKNIPQPSSRGICQTLRSLSITLSQTRLFPIIRSSINSFITAHALVLSFPLTAIKNSLSPIAFTACGSYASVFTPRRLYIMAQYRGARRSMVAYEVSRLLSIFIKTQPLKPLPLGMGIQRI